MVEIIRDATGTHFGPHGGADHGRGAQVHSGAHRRAHHGVDHCCCAVDLSRVRSMPFRTSCGCTRAPDPGTDCAVFQVAVVTLFREIAFEL